MRKVILMFLSFVCVMGGLNAQAEIKSESVLRSDAVSKVGLRIDENSNQYPVLEVENLPQIARTPVKSEGPMKVGPTGSTILGWRSFDQPKGWFELGTDGTETMLWQNSYLEPAAGFIKDGKLYSYYAKNFMGQLSVYYYINDLTTGEILESGPLNNTDASQFVLISAYDSDQDIVYAYTYSADGATNWIQAIDPDTREFTKICEPSEAPRLISYNPIDGKIYGISKTGDFIRLNVQDGSMEVIGSTGFTPSKYKQTMTYSPIDKKFIWAALMEDLSACVIAVDPITGEGEKLGDLPLYTEYNILVTTDELQDDTKPSAPEIVFAESIKDAETYKGTTIEVPVVLNNENEIIAFQCNLYLSDGLSIDKTNGVYDIYLTDRKGADHQLSTSLQQDGSIKVLCYSMQNLPFSGNDGALFNIRINVADEAVGEQSVSIRDIILTTTSKKYTPADISATITVKDYAPGDANGDACLDVMDIVYIAQYIHGNAADDFLPIAGDYNGDGSIDVFDIVNIVTAILNENAGPAIAKDLGPLMINTIYECPAFENTTASFTPETTGEYRINYSVNDPFAVYSNGAMTVDVGCSDWAYMSETIEGLAITYFETFQFQGGVTYYLGGSPGEGKFSLNNVKFVITEASSQVELKQTIPAEKSIISVGLIEKIDFTTEVYSPNASREAEEMLQLTANVNSSTIAVGVDSNESLSAYQMDLYLPNGVEVINITSNDATHSLTYKVSGNKIRVISYSLSLSEISDNSNLFNIELSSNVSEEILINNILFSDSEGNGKKAEAMSINPSGIDNVNGEVSIYAENGKIVIVSNGNGVADVVSVDGVVRRYAITEGRNEISVSRGIYIVKTLNRTVKVMM